MVRGRRTCDQKIASSVPGQCIAGYLRSTQPSIPPGLVNRVPAYWLGLRYSLVSGAGITGR